MFATLQQDEMEFAHFCAKHVIAFTKHFYDKDIITHHHIGDEYNPDDSPYVYVAAVFPLSESDVAFARMDEFREAYWYNVPRIAGCECDLQFDVYLVEEGAD